MKTVKVISASFANFTGDSVEGAAAAYHDGSHQRRVILGSKSFAPNVAELMA
jgi:hypothetical protein